MLFFPSLISNVFSSLIDDSAWKVMLCKKRCDGQDEPAISWVLKTLVIWPKVTTHLPMIDEHGHVQSLDGQFVL